MRDFLLINLMFVYTGVRRYASCEEAAHMEKTDSVLCLAKLWIDNIDIYIWHLADKPFVELSSSKGTILLSFTAQRQDNINAFCYQRDPVNKSVYAICFCDNLWSGVVIASNFRLKYPPAVFLFGISVYEHDTLEVRSVESVFKCITLAQHVEFETS